jgi:hypothetical protein
MCDRDLVHFTVAVLETSGLGLEEFEFSYADWGCDLAERCR